MRKITILLLGLFLVVGIFFFLNKEKERDTVVATSFEECVYYGFPIMESYPRQCSDEQGNLFVEDIGNGVDKVDMIRVSNIIPNQILSNPFTLSGEARGNWYFEASFPVKLIDENGVDLLLTPPYVTANGKWMTTEFVPFEGEFNFTETSAVSGTLILQKDNPSGLTENDDSLIIPVKFR